MTKGLASAEKFVRDLLDNGRAAMSDYDVSMISDGNIVSIENYRGEPFPILPGESNIVDQNTGFVIANGAAGCFVVFIPSEEDRKRCRCIAVGRDPDALAKLFGLSEETTTWFELAQTNDI